MYMFSTYYASLANIVRHARKIDIDADDVIIETIAESLVVLHGTDTYWLEIDEHGYIHAYCNSNVRNNWMHWGCLPYEEIVASAMRDVEILRRSPHFKTAPSPLTGKTHPLELRDEQGVLCEWVKRSWINPTFKLVPTLRASCVFLYAGADCRAAEASILEHLPSPNTHSSLFAVQTVLWFDSHAPWIDTRLLTPKLLKQLSILRISRENFMEMEDFSDVIMKKRHVARAHKNDSLFVPRTSLHWRGVVSRDGISSYGISYNWRIILVSCPAAYATGTFSPDTLITVLPEELTLVKEPTVEQLAHVLDTSWKISFPKMHLEMHMFEEGAAWPLAEYGLMRVDGVISRSAYVRHTHKVGILLHESLVEKAFEGFALQGALHLKKPLLERDVCCICASAHVNCIVECGHLFCHSCITQAYAESTNCPTCRRHFVEWTCLSTTIRIPCEKTYHARIAVIVKASSNYVLLTPCEASQNVLQEWFPAMTVCQLSDFQIPPYKNRLLITWTPSKEQLGDVHRVIQEFAGEGKRVEIITTEVPLDISKAYTGMSESSTYYD